MTLQTRPEDIYRALVEATAFGTRVIVDGFDAAGVPVRDFTVAGGLHRNPFVMQVYADVLRRPLHVMDTEQAPALGSAMHAAVAAGEFADIAAAAEVMAKVRRDVWQPDAERADALRLALRRVPPAPRPLRARGQRRDAPPPRPPPGGVGAVIAE